MADLNLPANTSKGNKNYGRRSKKLSTRIDLTPMVDLGFLLITFFLYTTTLAQPKVMPVMMPAKATDKDASEWKDGQTTTLLLAKDHRIYYYNGIGDDPTHPPVVRQATFNTSEGIRQVIRNRIQEVKKLQREGVLNSKNDAAFLIKADITSTYDDFVRIMDELNINDVKIKAVVDITPGDQALIAAYR